MSEGKNDPIYNAHSYHTKVPHKAIMRYILHYTEPGDVVLDGFCGTGMTGVAAQLLTGRLPILSDLSPVATNIANSIYLLSDNLQAIRTLKSVLQSVRKRFGWMYQTKYNGQEYEINYTVWADVHICPNCLKPTNYWELTIRLDEGNELNKPECPTAAPSSRAQPRPSKRKKSLIRGQVT